MGACQRVGMESGEECSAARAFGSCAVGTRDVWECDGCNVCLMHALKTPRRSENRRQLAAGAIFDETRREMREFSRSFWTEPAAWSSEIHAYKQGPDVVREFLENRERSHWCRTCAMALSLRPDVSQILARTGAFPTRRSRGACTSSRRGAGTRRRRRFPTTRAPRTRVRRRDVGPPALRRVHRAVAHQKQGAGPEF